MTHSIRKKATFALALTTSLFAFSACRTLPEDTVVSTPPVPNSATDTAATNSSKDAETTVLASGSFEGRNDHIVTGQVDVVESNGKYIIQLAEDFSLDNAPDPKVGLGKNGYDASTKAGNLIALTGASSYELPTNINAQDYNEVYIWCEKFDVPLGIAQLQIQ